MLPSSKHLIVISLIGISVISLPQLDVHIEVLLLGFWQDSNEKVVDFEKTREMQMVRAIP